MGIPAFIRSTFYVIRVSDKKVIQNDLTDPDWIQWLASDAHNESDKVLLQYLESGSAIPSAWATYRQALRAMIDSPVANATLPTGPVFP
jgi:hypothetical protein